ncbi:hypothetical protein ANO11243_077160 [Dothideomycetidae sp. 11243]|nr:hypothetical protein ANO11243_077160 [fungal sp. No.11243]
MPSCPHTSRESGRMTAKKAGHGHGGRTAGRRTHRRKQQKMAIASSEGPLDGRASRPQAEVRVEVGDPRSDVVGEIGCSGPGGRTRGSRRTQNSKQETRLMSSLVVLLARCGGGQKKEEQRGMTSSGDPAASTTPPAQAIGRHERLAVPS